MGFHLPRTLREWIVWGLSTIVAGVVVRIFWVLVGLNVETWAQDNKLDRVWATRWVLMDPFSAGLGWWLVGGAFAAGALVGFLADGLLRKKESGAVLIPAEIKASDEPETPPDADETLDPPLFNVRAAQAKILVLERLIPQMEERIRGAEEGFGAWLNISKEKIFGRGLPSNYRGYVHMFERWRAGLYNVPVEFAEAPLELPPVVADAPVGQFSPSAPNEGNMYNVSGDKPDEERFYAHRSMYAQGQSTLKNMKANLERMTEEKRRLEDGITAVALGHEPEGKAS